ncbi:MAG: SurA N-terminal domain-containing protein [Proteobacteria bacterium]|nr:SurA N-terminal domain-containing protein [Pseudomonadota bacterium]MBU1687909.1 SurA N-terminal domain-containing protein [Pseudomonadota bacterium]
MLDLLRRKAQSTVIQVAILAIVLVFIFWGVGTNQGNGINAVAMVNDEPITYVEYQRSYEREVSQIRDQLGGVLPDTLLQSLGMKQQVLDRLIQRTLLLQSAREMGLMVSADEVRQTIEAMEAFKRNGGFDVGWYQEILAGNRMSTTEFEASVTTDLLSKKIYTHLQGFGQVSEKELAERLRFEFRRKQFSYVEIAAADYDKKVNVSDDELAAYFGENQDRYKTRPRMKLKYVLFPFGSDQSVEVPEADITAYYEQHKDEYVVPEQRQAHHILIKVVENATEETAAAALTTAEDLLKQVREGKKFEDLARQFSEDSGSKGAGGDLGFFGRGQMVKPFEDAVFGLEEGAFSLVRSTFGYHVIRVDKIRPLSLKKVDEVKDTINAVLHKGAAKKAAFRAANDAYEKIILSGSLAKFAEAGGTVIQETDYFSQVDPPAVFKGSPEITRAAFNLKQGELSSLVEGGDSYAVLFAQELKEPEVPELASVRARVESDFVKDRALTMAEEAAQGLLVAIKGGADIASEAGNLGAQVKDSVFISRAENTESKLAPAIIEAGLALTARMPFPEKVETVGRSFYVMAYKGEQELPENLVAEKQEDLKKKMADENSGELLANWINYLKSKAEITIKDQLL